MATYSNSQDMLWNNSQGMTAMMAPQSQSQSQNQGVTEFSQDPTTTVTAMKRAESFVYSGSFAENVPFASKNDALLIPQGVFACESVCERVPVSDFDVGFDAPFDGAADVFSVVRQQSEPRIVALRDSDAMFSHVMFEQQQQKQKQQHKDASFPLQLSQQSTTAATDMKRSVVQSSYEKSSSHSNDDGMDSFCSFFASVPETFHDCDLFSFTQLRCTSPLPFGFDTSHTHSDVIGVDHRSIHAPSDCDYDSDVDVSAHNDNDHQQHDISANPSPSLSRNVSSSTTAHCQIGAQSPVTVPTSSPQRMVSPIVNHHNHQVAPANGPSLQAAMGFNSTGTFDDAFSSSLPMTGSFSDDENDDDEAEAEAEEQHRDDLSIDATQSTQVDEDDDDEEIPATQDEEIPATQDVDDDVDDDRKCTQASTIISPVAASTSSSTPTPRRGVQRLQAIMVDPNVVPKGRKGEILDNRQVETIKDGKLCRFRCKICKRSFTKKTNCTSHVLTHSVTRVRFPCPSTSDCARTFTRRADVRRHLKSVHGVDDAESLVPKGGLATVVLHDQVAQTISRRKNMTKTASLVCREALGGRTVSYVLANGDSSSISSQSDDSSSEQQQQQQRSVRGTRRKRITQPKAQRFSLSSQDDSEDDDSNRRSTRLRKRRKIQE
jgi:Zinc finger, C2H2 type